ncbi:MAG: type III pantothenate kinase [Alphaproteobacteria bacterium]|nr:type III pantothenate kinase [Alphaproteobacteria bacterium]
MLLAIDCGNTNTVIALFDGMAKRAHWRMATDPKRTADDHAVWLNHHLTRAGMATDQVTDIVISTVVPACLRSFEGLAEQLSAQVFVIDAARGDHGVKVKIPEPRQAGADRLANTSGAASYPLPAMVIDFGTATTFDLIDGEGAYIGGAIAPGVNLSINALHQAAARLPLIETTHWTADTPVLGATTVDAMNSGLYYGYISLVEGMITRLKAAYGHDMTVIATGGLANIFSTEINGVDHHDPDLTIRGMAMIYAQQIKETP